MMLSGLNKLGVALTIISIISSVGLFARLFYLLWRLGRSHDQIPVQATLQGGTTTADSNYQTFSYSSSNFTSSLFLYFFCCLNGSQTSRVEPTSTLPTVNSTGSCLEDEMEVIDVFELQNMSGPSRVLFTIKEEERENDVESEKSVCSSAEKGTTHQEA